MKMNTGKNNNKDRRAKVYFFVFFYYSFVVYFSVSTRVCYTCTLGMF